MDGNKGPVWGRPGKSSTGMAAELKLIPRQMRRSSRLTDLMNRTKTGLATARLPGRSQFTGGGSI